MTTRRTFLGTSLAAGAAWSLGGPRFVEARPAGPTPTTSAPHPLRILILGGTGFIGPHEISYALGRGHSVTTFTRGRSTPSVHADLLREVEQLVGDRESDLSALEGRDWDAVIDNSGQREAWTVASAELLRDRVDLYVYTSSTGVYYPYPDESLSEDREVALSLPDGMEPGQDGAYDYGVMKARSERAARRIFGDDRTIVVRPTYIMGPGDTTDRFIYWPLRLAEGGEVMIPGRPEDPVQYIDARDVASFTIRLIEQRAAGVYNAVGPASTTGVRRFVHGAHAAFSSEARFVQVPDYDFLREHGVRGVVPWIMPAGNNVGSARANPERSLAAGMTLTPLAQSVRDMYDWWRSGVVSDERRERVVRGERSLLRRESEILADWGARP